MKNSSKIFVLTVIILVVLQALVILFSWIISAIWPSLGIHSLLSDSGLRWLLSSVSDNLSGRLFTWFLMASVFIGTFIWSGLPKKIISYRHLEYRDRLATNLFFVIIIIAVLISVTLAMYPHSSLLGVSGHLVPGPYVDAVLLIFGLSFFGGSVVFSILSEKVKNYKDAEKACIFGLQGVAPLIVIYFLLKELLETVVFVALK